MKELIMEVHYYFRTVLGGISIEEIILNDDLIKQAERLNKLFGQII